MKILFNSMVTILFLLLFFYSFFTQTLAENYWARTFGESNEEASMAISSICGNKIGLAGWTKSFGTGYEDILFLIFNNDGNLIFQRTFGESQMDEGFALYTTEDCGVLVGGSTQYVGFGSGDIALIRLDSLGNTHWKTLLGNIDDDNVSSITGTPDGGFIATGFSHAPYGPGFNITIFKITSSGRLQWQKILQTDSIAYDYGKKIIKLKNGNLLVLCTSSSNRTNQKSGALLIEVTIDGEIVKNKLLFSQSLNLSPEGIVELDDGFIIVGTSVIGTEPKSDAFILKTSKDFTPIFCKLLKGQGYENLHNVILTSENKLYACGATSSLPGTGFDFWLIKFDNNGEFKFSKTYGGTYDEHSFALTATSDGGIAVAGWTFSFGLGASDIMVVKVDTSGYLPTNNLSTSNWEPTIDSVELTSQEIPLLFSNYNLLQQDAILTESSSNLIVIDINSNTSNQEYTMFKGNQIKLLQQTEAQTLALVINSEIERASEISFFDIFGKEVRKIPINLRQGTQYILLSLTELPKGIFFIFENSTNIWIRFINY